MMKKYTAVLRGRDPGIYNDWDGPNGAKKQILGFKHSKYKGFDSLEEAQVWINDNNRSFSDEEPISKKERIAKRYEKRLTALKDKGNTIIYCAGYARNYPGKGGWAYSVPDTPGTLEDSGAYNHTTTRRMKLRAMIQALKSAKALTNPVLVIDSEDLFNCVEKGWLSDWTSNNWRNWKGQSPIDLDLWEEYYELHQKLKPALFLIPTSLRTEPVQALRNLVGRAIKDGKLIEDRGFRFTKRRKALNKNAMKNREQEKYVPYNSKPCYSMSS